MSLCHKEAAGVSRHFVGVLVPNSTQELVAWKAVDFSYPILEP